MRYARTLAIHSLGSMRIDDYDSFMRVRYLSYATDSFAWYGSVYRADSFDCCARVSMNDSLCTIARVSVLGFIRLLRSGLPDSDSLKAVRPGSLSPVHSRFAALVFINGSLPHARGVSVLTVHSGIHAQVSSHGSFRVHAQVSNIATHSEVTLWSLTLIHSRPHARVNWW